MASTKHTTKGAMTVSTARSADGMDTCTPRDTARRYVSAVQGRAGHRLSAGISWQEGCGCLLREKEMPSGVCH